VHTRAVGVTPQRFSGLDVGRRADVIVPFGAATLMPGRDNLQVTIMARRRADETVDAATGDARPAFYGINCSHPLEFMPAIEEGDWFERVRVLRPNAAMMDKISLCTLGHLEVGDPAYLGELMGGLARQHPHIDMWGGCCGTWETHLEEIARNVHTVRAQCCNG